VNYLINRKFSSIVERTPRVLEVAEAFGLGLADKEFVVYDNLNVQIEQGDVVYITGQSGSGKSLLLRELAREMWDGGKGKKVADIDQVPYADKPLIDQVGKDMNDAVRLLSLAGLNDAYLFIRKPSELSDGQKYRFRLAKLIESGAEVWVADEFTAALDRVTAKVVAFNMQKIARQVGATLMVATTHMDLKEDLNPSLYVEKYFRNRVAVERSEERQ
jgi:hypothetical protein